MKYLQSAIYEESKDIETDIRFLFENQEERFFAGTGGVSHETLPRTTNFRHETNITMNEIVDQSLFPALKGLVVAVLSFVVLGTVSAVWGNPFFIRMTPAGDWEVGLLAVLSILIGAYMAIRMPACTTKSATTGGIIGFIGIACPVCNKILLLLFGGELLMTYFEPVRIYVAVLGVAVTAWAVWSAWRARMLTGRLEAAGITR